MTDELIRKSDALAAMHSHDWQKTYDAIRALPTVTTKVKPLAWDETHDDRGDGTSEHNGGYVAVSPLGDYEIGMGFGSDCYYWSATDPMLNEIGSFEDPNYAKSAAQADYEARILAALEPVDADPLSDPRVKALVETAEAAIAWMQEHDMIDGRAVLRSLERQPKVVRDLTAALREFGGEA